jgi:NTP pyrophosphatase (non-canonical NTP hydrolase)
MPPTRPPSSLTCARDHASQANGPTPMTQPSKSIRNRALPVSVEICGYPLLSTEFPAGFPTEPPTGSIVSLSVIRRPASILLHPAMPKKTHNPGQIVLFPGAPGEMNRAKEDTRADIMIGAAAPALDIRHPLPVAEPAQCQVVLSGSYRKDFAALKATYEELLDLGCAVLSPSNVTAVRETDGFVFMKGEESQLPDAIEARHLDAIQRANFVWLHAPEGYIGPTASLEIGFAKAIGVPVFAKEPVKDSVIHSFVEVISSPAVALETMKSHRLPIPRPALAAFQHYYRRVALQRGYKSESPKDCLLLMVEEVGELAREIRRRERLVRHGPPTGSSESKELADIFLYVVHMANVLDVDLSKVVQEKELINLQRFLRR